MRPEARQRVRVGAVVTVAGVVFAAAIFLIGEQSQLFRRKNTYRIRLETVQGLQEGNPVQLSGVGVGRVERIVLPHDPEEHLLVVHIAVDARYQDRIREDSEARIQTLGLLGDKFVQITSGSPETEPIPDGGVIAAGEATDVDRLLASGEDLVENTLLLSHSLVRIVQRLERGEGVIGQLLTDSAIEDQDVKGSIFAILESTRQITASLEAGLVAGEGPLGKLLHDPALAASLGQSIERLERLLATVESGEGLVPELLRDPEMLSRTRRLLANLESTSAHLAEAARALEDGEGLLPRLLQDEAYGSEVSRQLLELLERLNATTAAALEGEGTVAQLIQDPAIYEAINDILVGVEQSWMLRWLVRNRQKAGIEKRYRDRHDGTGSDGPGPGS